tara:strand:+ start:11163 stop:11417 length:255 start_codon:yes stop_codon:yes gene_type:complete
MFLTSTPTTIRDSPMTTPSDSFYTLSEAAEIMKLSTRTVRRMIISRKLSAHRIGVQYRISGEDLELFLRRRHLPADRVLLSRDG